MICPSCDQNLPDGSVSCPNCGTAFNVAQAQPPSAAPVLPSLYALKCPKCGGQDLLPLGEKGAAAAAFGKQFAFGAIGNLVASSNAQKDAVTSPIQYKCKKCNNKFVSPPLQAGPDEMLSAPCTVNFTRLSSFVGMAIVHVVYLNGVKVSPVKNGKTVTFPTYLKYNTIFVTDPHGVAFRDIYRFEAQPGGVVNVKFNRKFK